ncbi:hypothetical protein DSO57_1001486 [Entomophthora muscae]|uniref:Uncharacterized protein n=1 Tax=Entomophthora muscae TaxID=34485 RepID=A0ACC2UUD9_9FUNG|nr:hypothetical protein DSO57_1001486 [Entomophthora muscae]
MKIPYLVRRSTTTRIPVLPWLLGSSTMKSAKMDDHEQREIGSFGSIRVRRSTRIPSSAEQRWALEEASRARTQEIIGGSKSPNPSRESRQAAKESAWEHTQEGPNPPKELCALVQWEGEALGVQFLGGLRNRFRGKLFKVITCEALNKILTGDKEVLSASKNVFKK